MNPTVNDPFFDAIRKELAERLENLDMIKVRNPEIIDKERKRLERIMIRVKELEKNSRNLWK